ncbi:MAG: GNAT family N-acetyltransferase [Thermoplasmata archaeon]
MGSQHSSDRGERGTDLPPKSAPGGDAAGAKPEPVPPAKELPPPEKPALSVERLTHLDVNEVCGLYKKVWDAQRADLSPEMVKAWEPTPLEFTSWMEGVTYFAARRNGRLVGVVGLETSHGSGRFVHLAVEPEGRRQGVATALIRTTIEWAKKNGCASVWADTLARFTSAAQLLKHLDFEESGVLHRHEWSEDVRFFERLL